MTINVTQEIIEKSKPGTLECPVFRALAANGLNVHMVGVGHVAGSLVANAYLTFESTAIIQKLPSNALEAIIKFDKTSKMEPFSFEIPDLK